jgi:hypothetical protein
MIHFKDFLIKLQALDIKVNQRNKVINGQSGRISFYDISHQNPYLSASFKNEIKELKELAVTDILNLPREQIIFQLQRLGDVKELFSRFWHKLYKSDAPRSSEHSLDYLLSLDLNSIFIAPGLSHTDNAITDDNFINDLTDSVRARENILKEFEEAVSKVIDLPKETEKTASTGSPRKLPKAYPVFKEEILHGFFALVKNYFTAQDQQCLLKILTTQEDARKPLLFNGPGNQLADAFKQLYSSNLLTSCNKSELEGWIQANFQYRDKGMQKSYSEKYLKDIISSNTKDCQSPLFDVKKSDGKFYLSPLHKNERNQKR